MKRQIRKSVFETNSSSTHSITVCGRDDSLGWKLEAKRGETLVYENCDLFNCELRQGMTCYSSGDKFVLLLGLVGDFVDNTDIMQRMAPEFDYENDDIFTLPVFNYISEFLRETYDINIVWKRWDAYDEVDHLWLDENPGETLYKIYAKIYDIKDEKDYETELIELMTDGGRFKEFILRFITDEDIILRDYYEEW